MCQLYDIERESLISAMQMIHIIVSLIKQHGCILVMLYIISVQFTSALFGITCCSCGCSLTAEELYKVDKTAMAEVLADLSQSEPLTMAPLAHIFSTCNSVATMF